MNFILASIILFSSSSLYSKEAAYNGEVSFKAETNMPGVNIEGSSKNFKTLKADFSDDFKSIKKIEAEIDAETLKTGIDLRDQHMYEKVFFVLSAKEKPALLKMILDKATCEKESAGIKCKGDANFTFGKKAFSKKIDLKFDNLQNTQVAFNVSLKELALEIPSYLGIELEDNVSVLVKATKK
ncbi:MAG: hypothetical protein ACXVLQ_14095 [Bacteriovorax sp.]